MEERKTSQERNLPSVGGAVLTCADLWNAVMAVECRVYQKHKVEELKNNNGGKPRQDGEGRCDVASGCASHTQERGEDGRDKSNSKADAGNLCLERPGDPEPIMPGSPAGSETASPGS